MDRLKVIRGKLVRLFSVPWHPIVLSAYPVLALLAANVGEVKTEAAWRPLLVCAGIAGIIFLLWRLIFGDWNRAAFLTTLWLVLIFSYGHIQNLLVEKFEEIDFTVWLLIAWSLLALIAVAWAKWKSPSPAALNVIALGLVLMSLGQSNLAGTGGNARRAAAENAPLQDLSLPQNPPDVYYFILDM
ncbi:MAG TPA: hypothetical protein VHP14_12045, partial [Anaerolineales bacterium]|nr:hypothetical protein [Anaerolineales bacterium]